MSEDIPWYKSAWKFIVAAFLLLTGAFLWQKRKSETLEGELISADTKIKDAPLAERERVAAEAAAAEKAKLDQLINEHPEVKDMTPDQVKEYWKNR